MNNAISWQEYFMAMAHLAKMRSKDPNTKVGACIVDDNNRIVSMGYNGFPFGCSDDIFPWSNKGDPKNTKYMYVVHAELNAILNSNKSLKGTTLYVSLFPCNECAKAIIQSGIKKVIYEDDKYADTDSVICSKKMFDHAKVEYVKLPYKIDVKLEKINNKNSE